MMSIYIFESLKEMKLNSIFTYKGKKKSHHFIVFTICFLFGLKRGFHSAAGAALELGVDSGSTVALCHPPNCLNHEHEPPHLAQYFLIFLLATL